MARNHRTALYLNDPIKWIAGVLSIRQALSLAAIGLLTYALVKLTAHVPYDRSTAGQLHLLLVIGVPGVCGFLAWNLLDKGAVEPYPKQLAGYLLRTAADLPQHLALVAYATARRTRARHDAARAACPLQAPHIPTTGPRFPTTLRALMIGRQDATVRPTRALPALKRPRLTRPSLMLPARLRGRLRLPTTSARRRDTAAGDRPRTSARARRPSRPATRYTMAYRDRAARRRHGRRRRALPAREVS